MRERETERKRDREKERKRDREKELTYIMVLDGVGELVAPVPGVEEPSRYEMHSVEERQRERETEGKRERETERRN